MTFPDQPYEEAANKHRTHKANGVDKKTGCKMCRFYEEET